jgi:GMP synthase (glutamine-hydrolysing)
MPCTQKVKELGWKPKGCVCPLSISPPSSLFSELHLSVGVILSGSPYSVYDSDSPHVDPEVFELGVPILGICYGLQVPGRYLFIYFLGEC